MKEYTMESSWRTVQLFLTKDYVAEVEVNATNSKEIRCNCKGFKGLGRCNHIKYVKKHMQTNDGHYTIQIPREVDEDLAEMAMSDSEMFRQFIIDYAKVEVLD
jgi:DNA gyrase/topoisomerase IV subunit B